MTQAQRKRLEKQGYIMVFWHKDDIRSKAEEMEVELTDEQVDEIANDICRNHDAEYGINWDSIEFRIQEIVDKTTQTLNLPLV